ncbi:hypothetical protein [Chitinophaga caseinilytica]|uniref:hypothetical protein n=1 Tax=Chitinophaga caseinilytica TaxID=2267521 RepID=UPI003C2C4404
MITVEELYDWYQGTLAESGSSVLEEDDVALGTYIFEDFVIDAHSCLHPDCLKRLHENGLISEEKMALSLQLRTWASEIDARGERGVEKVRTSAFWRDLMALSDRISSMK